MAFVVFGFYGTGKTTFCKENPTIAKEYDSEYYRFVPDMKQNLEKDLQTDTILFINRLEFFENYTFTGKNQVQLIFLPKNKNVFRDILYKRNTQPEFIKEILKEYPAMIRFIQQYAKKYQIPFIILDKNEYITHYKNFILEKARFYYEHQQY